MLEQISELLGVELLSVLAGVSGGIVTYGFLNWNQRRIERDRFRRSLMFEIEHIGNILERLDEVENATHAADLDELRAGLSTDLLDSDFQSIGKLTTRELQHVYRFYESSRVVREKLANGVATEADTALQKQIQTAMNYRDIALQNINRSRLSKLTEWYKNIDANR